MKIVILDTETTGLMPGQIAQLSYIVADGEKILKAVNHYFEVDHMEAGAARTHGLTIEKLKVLSGGKRFRDITEELLADLNQVELVCHNVPFDTRFVGTEIRRCGLKYHTAKSFCTMAHYTDVCQIGWNDYHESYKWPRLDEVLRYLEIPNNSVTTFANKLFNATNTGAHDSRFDVAATWMIYQAYLKGEGQQYA